MFDLNDFDETLPGPFEYDVKRMAASFVIGGRNNGFSAADARSAAGASVAAYRKAMAEFAEMGTMDIWYARLPADQILSAVGASAKTKQERKMVTQAGKALAKAKTRDSLQALSKLSEEVDGQRRIISDPPVLIPERELGAGLRPLARGDGEGGSRTVPRLPLDAPRRPPQAPGTLPPGRHGAQGRGRGQRGHPGIHRVDGWP